MINIGMLREAVRSNPCFEKGGLCPNPVISIFFKDGYYQGACWVHTPRNPLIIPLEEILAAVWDDGCSTGAIEENPWD